MSDILHDVRVSLRRLKQSPGFTAAAIVTLALGIGGNTAIFTVVNTLVFRPLPVAHPRELAFLNASNSSSTGGVPVLSYPNYVDLRDRNQVLSSLVAYRVAPVSLGLGGERNARIWGYEVSGNYFETLGVAPLRGRWIGVEDDRLGDGHAVAVISFRSWQQRFGGDAEILGKSVKLNGLDYTIVGIAPPGFFGTEVVFTPEIWVPMAMQAQIEPGLPWLDQRRTRNIFVLGRLNPGVTMRQAEAALNSIAAELGREYPAADEGLRLRLSPPGLLGSLFRGPILGFAAVLMAVAGLVLLIACVNLAGMLLARASDRRKETAIALALGASRGRLVRQFLTESLLLSLMGGGAGLLLAMWLADLFSAWRPPIDVPLFPALALDVRVMLFAAGVSLLTGILFGLVPALETTRGSLTPALKNETASGRLWRLSLRDVLVAAQIAMSVALLAGSVLVVRSLQSALHLHLGFEPQHAASVTFDLGLQGYDSTRGREFQRRLLANVRAIPGIETAAFADNLPMRLNFNTNTIYVEGKPAQAAADVPGAAMFTVGEGYFKAMQTKLIAGRDFDDRDKLDAVLAVVVNQEFARQLLPGEDPLGKRFRYDLSNGRGGQWRQIVGVVEDGKYRSLGESALPVVFRPFSQEWAMSANLVARSTVLPEAELVNTLRRSVMALDPALPLYDPGSLTHQLDLAFFPARAAAGVLSAFGILAIVLAVTGVYGTMAYAVSRRTREIGIRMALGADSVDVARLALARVGILLAAGTVVGVALALVAGRFLSVILYGVNPRDPVTIGSAVGLMAVVALVACWLPTRRAVSIDPITALRAE